MNWVSQTVGLSGLDTTTCARLDRLKPMVAAEGTALFHPGEAVKGFVIVLTGQVDVFLTGPTGREILLYSIEPGQSCVQTTLGLLGGEAYSGEAVVRQTARLVIVPRETFLDIMEGSQGFRAFVFSAFATRMQSMMHLLEKVAFQRVETRLANCLLARSHDNKVIAIHAQIATLIGTAREVVSRRLDTLERRGVVQLGRGAVHIVDATTLKEIAATD